MDEKTIRLRFMRLAASKPKGSEERKKLIQIFAAATETFRSQGGKKFTIKTSDFVKFLVERMGLKPGVQTGEYLREETLVPDVYLIALRDEYNAKVVGLPADRSGPRGPQAPRGPDINVLWDKLLAAMRVETLAGGDDAGDMFVNMPREMDDDDFDDYLQTAAGDVGQSVEYALSGSSKAGPLLDKLIIALSTGVYQKAHPYDKWNLNYRMSLLKEAYADFWYGGMHKGWEKIQRDSKELARLKAMRRPGWDWKTPSP